MSAPPRVPPPPDDYWAYCPWGKLWAVREPGVDFPEKPLYICNTIEDVITWMTVREIDRMQIRRERGDVVTVWWIVRAGRREGGKNDG